MVAYLATVTNTPDIPDTGCNSTELTGARALEYGSYETLRTYSVPHWYRDTWHC